MAILDSIVSSGISSVVDSVGKVIDKLTTTDDERNQAKLQATELINKSVSELLNLQTEVLKTEMQGNWLQRSWRPIMMLSFIIFLASTWFGFTHLPDSLNNQMFDLVKIGMGGYVVGRSVEKVADSVSKMDFSKK